MDAQPDVLVVDDGTLDVNWPFLAPRLLTRFQAAGQVTTRARAGGHTQLSQVAHLSAASAVIVFGIEPGPADIAAMSSCVVMAGETDRCGLLHADSLWQREIPFIDGTGGWSQSCAEAAIGLMIAALRRFMYWHQRALEGPQGWTYQHWQFCDDPAFVNGTLRGKTVAIIGLGAVGSRIASLCTAFGASVAGVDPYVPDSVFTQLGADRVALKDAAKVADIFVAAIPATPTADGVITADVIATLAPGTIVVTVTRTDCINMPALRQRVTAGELFWATDVYDTEPVPLGDPVLGLANVIHLPHIAGRTRDANHAVADTIADGVLAVLSGRQPAAADLVTPELVQRRLGSPTLRHHLEQK